MARYYLIINAAAICFLMLSGSYTAWAFDQSHPQYAKVLRQFVKNGSVDYGGLKSNPGELKSYLKDVSTVSRAEFNNWTEQDQLAFLINVYNAATLDLVRENFPVTSIKEIKMDSGGPWEQPVVNLFGETITLNALENNLIRKGYNEPRIHFALVCAAKSCPVLIGKPYLGETLNAQLDNQTKVFLTDPRKNSIDKEKKVVKLSPLFDWFSEDFIKESGAVINFVNPYMGGGAEPDFKIEYTDYDWNLNGTGGNN